MPLKIFEPCIGYFWLAKNIVLQLPYVRAYDNIVYIFLKDDIVQGPYIVSPTQFTQTFMAAFAYRICFNDEPMTGKLLCVRVLFDYANMGMLRVHVQCSICSSSSCCV